MSSLTCDEARELVPLSALSALDVDEQDVLDDHLEHCADCLRELASYSEVTAQLALALPQSDPSPDVKSRLLAQASRPRALPSPPMTGGGVPTPLWRTERAQRFRTTLSSLVAGVAIVVAAGSSYWAYNLQSQLTEQSARIASLNERAQNYQRVASVLQAADTQVRVLQSTQATAPARPPGLCRVPGWTGVVGHGHACLDPGGHHARRDHAGHAQDPAGGRAVGVLRDHPFHVVCGPIDLLRARILGSLDGHEKLRQVRLRKKGESDARHQRECARRKQSR